MINRMNTVYHMTQNSRTAGSMPVWGSAPSSQDQDIKKLDIQGINNEISHNSSKETFGFRDLIDMVNPLQHIPLVNIAYQKIVGDEIKPISKIVGGAVFGGVLGAGSALADVAITAQTGKNIGEHALAFASQTTAPSQPVKSSTEPPKNDHPEDNLNAVLVALEEMDAHSAIAYADLGGQNFKRYETQPVAQGRTAGHRVEEHFDLTAHKNIPVREPITEVRMGVLPPRRQF